MSHRPPVEEYYKHTTWVLSSTKDAYKALAASDQTPVSAKGGWSMSGACLVGPYGTYFSAVNGDRYVDWGGMIHEFRDGVWWVVGVQEEETPKQPKCDCGGEKANTTHSDWCSTNG